jgi:hypothetical protein
LPHSSSDLLPSQHAPVLLPLPYSVAMQPVLGGSFTVCVLSLRWMIYVFLFSHNLNVILFNILNYGSESWILTNYCGT